jgi:helicase
LLDWTQDIFTCSCEDNPYCECGRKKIQETMLILRLEGLKNVNEIRQYFMDNYQIQIFRGDLYDFYDQVIYNLRSIFEISKSVEIHAEILDDVNETPSILENLME